MAAAWVYGTQAIAHHSLDDRTQRVTRPTAPVPARDGIYGRGSARWVAQRIDIPATDAARVDVAIAAPIDVDARSVAVRAGSVNAIVRVGRNDIDEPVVHVRRVAGGRPVQLLVVRPATDAERASPAARNAPPLSSVTRPFERRVAQMQQAAHTFDRIRRAGAWLVPLLVLFATGMPLFMLVLQRQRWFGGEVPRSNASAPTGPPGTGAAITAAFATFGTRAIDLGEALAGQVFELVDAGVVNARRVHEARTGGALMLRIARRPDGPTQLVQAALDVLDLHTPEASTSLLLADAGGTVDETARIRANATWRAGLERAQIDSRQIEQPRWIWWLRTGQLLSLVMVGAVVGALKASAGGSAPWWLLLGALAAGAYTVRQVEQELRTWRRVPPGARTGRAQWLAWHDVLAGQAPEQVDPRSLAYAAATGLGARLLPKDVAPGTLGLAALNGASLVSLTKLVTTP